MKNLVTILLSLSLLACTVFGSNASKPNLSNKEEIAKFLNEKFPVGTSSDTIMQYFKGEGIRVMELEPLPKRPAHTLSVSYVLKRSIGHQREVIAVFFLSKDKTLEKITTSESVTGL